MNDLIRRLRRMAPLFLVVLALGLTVPACGSITGPKFPDAEIEEPDPDGDNDPTQEG